MDKDTVYRQQAIDAFYPIRCKLQMMDDTQMADKVMHGLWLAEKAIKALPSAQPEPSIPLSWIDEQIERLKGMDNAFATLTAMQISVMVKKWNGEQDDS